MAVKKTAVEEKKPNMLAVKETPIKNILKESVGVIINFTSKEETEKKLKKMVKDHSKRLNELVEKEDLTKPEHEELKVINATFRDTRYELQNIDKHNTGVFNSAKKTSSGTIDEFKIIISPIEDKAKARLDAEENKIEAAKKAAKEAEEKRIKEIEDKITNAGLFFEEELEKARKSGDWSKYDEYYKTFENNLESLEQLEFEGTEVLEKYKKRKEEILELIEQAAAQSKTAEAQKEKENELAEKENKLIESKRRMKAFFGIGFMFNGEAFTNGESVYHEDDVDTWTNEDFDKVITHWEELKEAEENEVLELAERVKNHNELFTEAFELKLDVEINESELGNAEKILELENLITEAKTEAGRLAAEEKAKEEAEKEAELKRVGKLICDSVNANINKIIEDFAGLGINQENNLDALNFFNQFVTKVDVNFMALKANLKQTNESI